MKYSYTYKIGRYYSDFQSDDLFTSVDEMHWLTPGERERVHDATGIEWADDGETIKHDWRLS